MSYTTLTCKCDAGLAVIRLNRPEVRNAFNEVSIAELIDVFRTMGAQAEIRAIVLAANGPAFCAGGDLNWMRKMAAFTQDENLVDAGQLAKMLHTIYTCPQPVIARIQGDCYAGGVGLAAACDIAVAATSANFCLSEVKIGLIPATIAPYVIRAIGEQAARRYFVTAERFAAQEAHRIGLVHAVAPADLLDATVDEIARALLTAGPQAVREAKRLVREVAGVRLTEGLIADTVKRIAAIRASDEGREGVSAFLEKRKPRWLL